MPNNAQNLTPKPLHQTGGKVSDKVDLSTVGEGIVSRLSSVLDHKISVTDLAGNIVADSEISNFDKLVPSALTAIQKGTDVELPTSELDEMSGWIIPLKHHDRTIGTLIIRNQPQPSKDVTSLAKSLAELLLYQILVMDRVAQENRIVDKFFYDLFETDQPQSKIIRDTQFFNSQYLQIDFSIPRIVGVISINNFWSEIYKNQPILPGDEQRLTVIKDKISDIAKDSLKIDKAVLAYLGQDDFSILLPYKTEDEDDKKSSQTTTVNRENLKQFQEKLEKEFSTDVFLGVGQYYPEIPGLINSYRDGKKVVHLGKKLQTEEKIYFYPEMLLPVLLDEADPKLKLQFVNQEIGELIKEKDLMDTLIQHYNSNLNLKKTAYELGIHKNTLYYRLSKIKDILGFDPQEFNKAIKLKLALSLWKMSKEDNEDNEE